jgi:hypothetical protein
MRGWRKLHNKELCNLYSLPSIIRVTKSRQMRWAGHVERMGEKRTHVTSKYWLYAKTTITVTKQRKKWLSTDLSTGKLKSTKTHIIRVINFMKC